MFVRISGNQVSIADPEAINPVFKSGWNKTSFYYWFRFYNRPTLMSTELHSKHLEMKRGLATTFANSTLLGLEEFIDNYSMDFAAILEDHARHNEPLEAAKWFQWYALDVVADVAFGHSFEVGYLFLIINTCNNN